MASKLVAKVRPLPLAAVPPAQRVVSGAMPSPRVAVQVTRSPTTGCVGVQLTAAMLGGSTTSTSIDVRVLEPPGSAAVTSIRARPSATA